MKTRYRIAGMSLLAFLASTSLGIQSANAAFLSVQLTDTVGGSTAQTGFTGWDFSSYNTTSGPGPQSTSFSVTDPGVPGGSVGVDVAQGTTVDGSGILNGTGNFASRVRSPGYTGTYASLYTTMLFAQGSSTTLTLEITGLVPTNSYNLTLFGADSNNAGTESFAGNLNGTTGSTPTGSETWTTSASGGSPTSLTQYASTLVLTPNSSGQITVNITDSGGSLSQGFLNGFQIADAPEPASFGAAASVMVALAMRRQRRRGLRVTVR